MAKIKLSDDELWKRVEEDRLREERRREPYLIAFRATPEEVAIREAEDLQQGALGEERIALFAEKLVRGGREMVRFERYLIRQGFFPNIPKGHQLGVDKNIEGW